MDLYTDCTLIFYSYSCTIIKTWNSSMHPSIGECRKKMWYVQVTENCWATERTGRWGACGQAHGRLTNHMLPEETIKASTACFHLQRFWDKYYLNGTKWTHPWTLRSEEDSDEEEPGGDSGAAAFCLHKHLACLVLDLHNHVMHMVFRIQNTNICSWKKNYHTQILSSASVH